MSRTARFLGGFTTGYVHMVVATAVGLWLTPFLLGRLGAESYGLWLVGTQIVAYLLLMDFGIVALLPRETAYVTGRTGRSDAPELRGLIEQTLTLALLQVPVVLVAAVVAVLWLPPMWQPLRVPLSVVLGLFVLSFPLRTCQAALVGLQDLAFVGQVQFGGWIAGTATTVALVIGGFGLSALAAGWCATQLVILAGCTARLAMRFPSAMPRRISLGPEGTATGYVGRSFWVAVGQTAQVLLSGTDVMIIGALWGPAAVVPYACTGKLIAVLANQPQAILQSAAPALSELRPSGDRARLFHVSAALSQATLAVSGLVACIVLAVNQGFVTWWVGAEQFAGMGLTFVMLAAMLARHFNTTNVYTLFCFGHERRLALTALADGVVTIVAGLLFVAAFGTAGAPLGAIAGVAAVAIPLNLGALSAETGVSRRTLIASLSPWATRFAIVAVIAGLSTLLIRPSTVPALVTTVLAAAAVYALAVASPILRSPAGAYLQPIIVSIGRRVAPARLKPRTGDWLS